MRYYYIVFYIIFFIGCSSKEPQIETLQDIQTIPQDVHYFTRGIASKKVSTLQKYKKDYYRVWNIDAPSVDLKKAMWAYDVFTYGKSYGENFQLIAPEFFKNIALNSNFEAYGTLNKKAISLYKINLRAFPTNRALFYNPKKAGEGFPFDYLQNSSLAANKPLFVSHLSKDKRWAFVESSFTFGWVERKDILFLSEVQTKMWQNKPQAVVQREKHAVHDKNGRYLFQTQLGEMFPFMDENATKTKILVASSGYRCNGQLETAALSKGLLHQGILNFNRENIDLILSQLQKNIYGWGGMYNERDCSSTIRDFFAPFGVWLPRNSLKQAKIGRVISLKNMTNQQKIATIKKYGIPFETLLYKRGHIVLYVGEYKGKIVIFHNTWGVKTKDGEKAGRFIVGKAVFSTLELGKELQNYDQKASILHHLESMNILF